MTQPVSLPDELVVEVTEEFINTPTLKLTMLQVARLWGLDHATCTALVEHLTDGKFLTLSPEGDIIRRSQTA